jgi:5-methylcytosine-specific restriction endonuclease McrBC regulatory subunit McrC
VDVGSIRGTVREVALLKLADHEDLLERTKNFMLSKSATVSLGNEQAIENYNNAVDKYINLINKSYGRTEENSTKDMEKIVKSFSDLTMDDILKNKVKII